MAPTKPPPVSTASGPLSKRPSRPRQQPLEFYNTTSTGHQQGSGVSKPSAWRTSRQGKINQQFSTKNPLSSHSLRPDGHAKPAPSDSTTSTPASTEKIFASCSIYISGSTSPIISDHRLKQLLSQNGAHICNIISRKTTTHVIVGSRGAIGTGAGGGLAAGKLQKEIAAKKPGSTLVKYVNVQWAIESLREGRKLSEDGFKVVETRTGSQRGILGMLQT